MSSGLRNFTVTGANGSQKNVGITVQAGDRWEANKLASRLLASDNSRGKSTFTHYNTKEGRK